MGWLSRVVGRSSANTVPELDELLKNADAGWHLMHLKSRIFETEEKLHLQLVWQRIGRLWLVLGNAAICLTAVLADALNWSRLSPVVPYLYGAIAASLLVSPILVYLQYKRTRKTRLDVRRLSMLYREKQALEDAKASPDTASGSPLSRQKRYRDEMFDIIAKFREEANNTRRIHNRFQTVIIVGSIFASAIATASVSYSETRWASVAVTACVGLAAGFTGYFKYHERSYNLQQTADAIEREYEAVDLRVGKYANLDDEHAYTLFAESVERLRDEQNKRQQQLDQPVEAKRDE